MVDKYITLAKRGDLNSRRLAAARMRDEAMVKKLFDTLAPALQGPLRRLHARAQGRLSLRRFRARAVIELVDRDESVKGVEDKARSEAMKEAAASG